MSHENSETVPQKREIKYMKSMDRWFVIDTQGKNKGSILGSKNGYPNRRAADKYAEDRSDQHGKNFENSKFKKQSKRVIRAIKGR